MKKVVWLVVFLLLGTGAVIYLNPDWRAAVQRQSREAIDSTKTTTMYKWQDAQGQWQVSSDRPPEGVDYEVLEYHSDANVMPRQALTGEED